MNRDELANRIVETSILHGEFTLRSGRKSTWYIDKYMFTTKPDILLALGKLFAEKIPQTTMGDFSTVVILLILCNLLRNVGDIEHLNNPH